MNENCKTPCKTEGRFSAKYWRPRPESNRGARICSPLRHHSATWPLSGEIFALLGADPTPVNTQTLYADSTGHLAAMFGKRIYVVKRRRIETPSSVIMQGMTDSEIQRRTMIETQLRPSSVNNQRVLDAVAAIPRERFVPASLRPFAYIDEVLEVWPSRDGAPARFLLSPLAQARLIQLASVGANDRVLDIGCATGYSTALLAKLGGEVIGVEPEPELASAASANLRELGIANARIVQAPFSEGYAAGAPFDAIVIEGSVPSIPNLLFDQLSEGGRLVAIVASSVQPAAWLYIKAGGAVSGLPHFDVGAKPLPGFAPTPQFAF